MQAIILAAGMGKRLGELTKNNTKCMISVNGTKLIDRMLGQLSKLRLNRVIIVVGYEGQKLRDYIGHRFDDVLRIEYVDNPVYNRTNNIYSLAVSTINEIGAPFVDPTPNTPNESEEAALDITVKLTPWIVRYNDIEF